MLARCKVLLVLSFDHHVHLDVVAFAGNVVDNLEGEGEAYLLAAELGQETVVVTFASS